MLNIKYTNQFKKDYKLMQKRGYNFSKLKTIIELICEGKPLPAKYNLHYLAGKYKRLSGMSY